MLLRDADGYLAACRAQLTMLERQTAETVASIREQMRAPDVLPTTRARCRSMIDAAEGQLADVRALLEPLLPPEAEAPRPGPPIQVPSTLEYLPYLYRDWGWPAETNGENERALAMVSAVAQGRPLGRVVVLGAGGCRLAYDLHRQDPQAETVVVDVDPVLFAAASMVVRGGTVTLREANLEIGELERSSREWVLYAPGGPLPAERFHFLVADGVDPPFAPGAFDTVLTPWFLDQGPRDVRDFVSTVHRLLAPGGRWLNLGPLLYAPEVPIAHRFAREELFDLAARAGFHVDRWETASAPYLVSKLNGRGKVEWVLAFSATKLDASIEVPTSDPEGGPPAWLLFTHLPVPMFPVQSSVASAPRGSELVLAAIDGRRTQDDIARRIAEQVADGSVSLAEIRDAVRRCLADVHPGAAGER
ncbi:MAG: methyltransferase domain-containing protein [Gemmatimonadetes bacterium]|nr:methyltransferase domain-containing protein [Gemmatimonadota bacterium]